MGLHKLSVGDGYTYLTRQVAAHDTDVEPGGLGAYYAERGESPGRWLGTGLDTLGITADSEVTEAQMTALFGRGHHPDAAVIEARMIAAGGSAEQASAATRLGTPFRTAASTSVFAHTLATRLAEWNLAHDRPSCDRVPREVKSRIRTALGRELFTEQHGRAPRDARELPGFIATASRLASTTVAGYDLTFSPVKSVSTLWALAPSRRRG